MLASRLRSSCEAFRSVMSCPKTWKIQWSDSRTAEIETSIGNWRPSRVSARLSNRRPIMAASPSSRNRRLPSCIRPRIRGGIVTSARSLPSTSSGRQPNISSATGFQARIRPSSSIVTSASVELSTMVASRCSRSSSVCSVRCRRPATHPIAIAIGKYTTARARYSPALMWMSSTAAQIATLPIAAAAIRSPGTRPSSSATRAIGISWSPSSPFFWSEFSSRATRNPR